MRWTRCPMGHFYDEAEHADCPHCARLRLEGTSDTTESALRCGADADAASRWEFAPVVGWLVCTQGMHRGTDFRLTAGVNTIGREDGASVRLAGERTVSRSAHATVTYDPDSRAFTAESGEARTTLCNGRPLLRQTVLRRGDRLQTGCVELVFIPLCDASFGWTDMESGT